MQYDTYESRAVLETKLLTGHSNYDIVFSSGASFERLLQAKVFSKLDKTALSNSVNLDPEVMRRIEVHDPKNAAKLQDCGIGLLDEATDVLSSVLIYLGKQPNSRDPVELNAAADVLMKIRPYVRTISSVGNIDALANGNVCLMLGWGSVVAEARYRALDSANGVTIQFFVPREGAMVTDDVMSIRADAPHRRNAEKWLNYLMRPEVMAGITNAVKWPNGNRGSLPFVRDAIKNDPAIYPDAKTRATLHSLTMTSPEQARLVTRLWTRFRTGQ